jgi:dihydrofolate synthase/folylpolyglutamate synthase
VFVASTLGVDPDPTALQDVRWPGRCERIRNVLLDCAHNPPAAEALAEWMQAHVRGPVHLIFGAMRGKDVTGVLAPLAPLVQSVAVVTPDYPRRQPASEIVPIAQSLGMQAHDAGTVAQALETVPPKHLALVTGSCFLVGEARAHLHGVPFPECGLRTTAR